MELNYDFVRKVLLTCADSPEFSGPSDNEMRKLATDNSVSFGQLAYTIDCLKQAGYIDGGIVKALSGPIAVKPGNLTWEGNTYLSNIRNNTVWKETKQKVKDSGLSVSLQILGSVASSIVKNRLGL